MKYTLYKLQKVEAWEKKFLTKVLLTKRWNISEAARELEIDRSNLQRLIRKHSIERPEEYRDVKEALRRARETAARSGPSE